MTRGEKLNNPFDIEKSAIKWQGKIEPSSDATFEQFQTRVLGLRAGFLDLKNQPKEGLDTIRKIITKFAPPSENNTEGYIKSICDKLQINPDDIVDLDDYTTLKALGLAVLMNEDGEVIYSDAEINQALSLAGVPNVPKPGIMQQPEAHVMGGVGALTTVAYVSNAVQSATPAIPLVQQILTYAPWVASVIVLGIIGYLIYLLYKKYKNGGF